MMRDFWFPLVVGAALFSLPSSGRGEEALRHVVFGSCLDKTEHPMLDRTLELPMDLFLFMGDNVYADKGGVPMMKSTYSALKESRFFRQVSRRCPILATWDDHDYGKNDGGGDYPLKKEAQAEFWNWLDEPVDSPRRHQEGVYQAKVFGPDKRRVQVILLDTRYFRSPLKLAAPQEKMLGGNYVPDDNPAATLLGPAQWAWLETELMKPAELRLIVSSIQVLPEAHGGESWANFPREQSRLLEVIQRTRAAGVVFLSGDRHWCEFSKTDGPSGYPLYDITASSMTQKHPRGTPTVNRNRLLAKTYHLPNVGRLEIDWEQPDPTITFEIVAEDGSVPLGRRLRLGDLQVRP
jgi:alkaline phosphatase D